MTTGMPEQKRFFNPWRIAQEQMDSSMILWGQVLLIFLRSIKYILMGQIDCRSRSARHT